MELETRHQCLIYDGSPSQQLPALAALIELKIKEGYRCLYMNSRPMVAGMRSYLSSIGVNVANEVARGSLVLSSESTVSEDGGFDIDLMLQQLEGAIDQATSDGYVGLWASGDMTWEFGSEANFLKLMEYEYKLEKVFRKRQTFYGICQYHKDTLPNQVPRQALLTHQMIFINETLSLMNPHYVQPGLTSDHASKEAELDQMIASLCQSKFLKS